MEREKVVATLEHCTPHVAKKERLVVPLLLFMSPVALLIPLVIVTDLAANNNDNITLLLLFELSFLTGLKIYY